MGLQSSFDVSDSAAGGYGGSLGAYGTISASGGGGGNASSTASGSTGSTSGTTSNLYASAIGGIGGSAFGVGNTAGNGGSATAIVNGTSTGGSPLYGQSSAYGGVSGTASDSATLRTPGLASATVTLNTTGISNASASSSGTSRVTNSTASSDATTYGPGSGSAAAELGSTPLSPSKALGLNMASFVVALPTAGAANAAISGNINNQNNFAFGTPNSTALGLFTMGVATTASAVTTDTWIDTAVLDINASSLPSQDLKLGLIDPSSSGFGTLTFTLTNISGTTILTQTFTSLAAADAFFSDNVVDLGKLSSFLHNGDFYLTASLSLTGATSASVVTDFVLGDSSYSVPEPPFWGMIAVSGVALLGMMHRRKHGAV